MLVFPLFFLLQVVFLTKFSEVASLSVGLFVCRKRLSWSVFTCFRNAMPTKQSVIIEGCCWKNKLPHFIFKLQVFWNSVNFWSTDCQVFCMIYSTIFVLLFLLGTGRGWSMFTADEEHSQCQGRILWVGWDYKVAAELLAILGNAWLLWLQKELMNWIYLSWYIVR